MDWTTIAMAAASGLAASAVFAAKTNTRLALVEDKSAKTDGLETQLALVEQRVATAEGTLVMHKAEKDALAKEVRETKECLTEQIGQVRETLAGINGKLDQLLNVPPPLPPRPAR